MVAFLFFFKTVALLVTISFLPLRSSAQDLESQTTELFNIRRINGQVTLDGMSDEAALEGIKSTQLCSIMVSESHGDRHNLFKE